MLIALAFILVGHAEIPRQVLQVRPALSQVCARHLESIVKLSLAPPSAARTRSYLRQTRLFLKRGHRDPVEREIRRELFESLRGPWETRIADQLIAQGLIATAGPGPWKIEPAALIRHAPLLARFVPRGFTLLYDPFYLLGENRGAQVDEEDKVLHLPVELLIPAKHAQVATLLAHEFAHTELETHPLSRYVFILDKPTFPRNFPPQYREQLSTEEFFTLTIDLLNRWRLERRGVRFGNDSRRTERSLRAFIAFYLEVLHPRLQNGSGDFDGDAYVLRDAPLAVIRRPGEAITGVRELLPAQNERIAEACRDLRARLDSKDDREASLLEFLRLHGLDPHAYLL